MKFGETFTEYLHGEQERFLNKCSHLEYKRLKKVLKSCRICRALQDNSGSDQQEESNESPDFCQCDSCPLCDQIFFAELTREASDIAGCFSSRVRRLLHLHVSSGMQRYMWRLRHCFTDDQQVMIQEGRMLLDYVTMNAIAIRKILKKYDKIHGSVNGREFKTKLRAKHIELLQSPWLIELDTLKYEYSLNCAICLDTLFNPYALSCGHLFCKSCACSSASVLLFQGLKTASQGAKCPICRAVGVYNDAIQMTELDLLLKNRCKDHWKERLRSERAEMVKQSKEYWQSQAILTLGL
ncbi:probable E3 ubiquitin-protein ligase BAH1-like 1 isoform X2 [Typha latifolia]|uniref:probable E3 ubiquitin-protein ligase BAH1-like 1 isoform X2 n=1 Tax=Typha latifolia TaxID=4733 RepID=UPI003C2EE495